MQGFASNRENLTTNLLMYIPAIRYIIHVADVLLLV